MAAFACRTRDSTGTVVEKTVDAASKREALLLLEESGLAPIRITEVAPGNPPAAAPAEAPAEATGEPASDTPKPVAREPKRKPGRKVKRRELMQFSIQLGSSLGAGVPILAGIQSASKQTNSQAFHEILNRIAADIEGGVPLSEAMARHPRVFSTVYVGTIAAGEKSGTLEDMLENLAEYLEGDMEMRSDVRSALLYPAIVICTLCLAIIVLIAFIVPRFTAFYSNFDAELPLATQMLIGVSSLLSGYFVWLGLGAAALIYGARKLVRVPAVRDALDNLLLRVPLIGRLIETANTLQAVQMLGLFTRAGVPVVEGMRTIARTASNAKFRRDLASVAEGIAVGQTLSEGLEAAGCFPTSARHMLASGEESGSMERACLAVAKHYKKELRYLTKNVSTFIEPLLTLVLAAVVLFIALAAFLPMWDLIKVVGK